MDLFERLQAQIYSSQYLAAGLKLFVTNCRFRSFLKVERGASISLPARQWHGCVATIHMSRRFIL
jgi:hypothetical protein